MNSVARVGDAITRRYPSINLNDRLSDAMAAMAEHNASALVVLQGNELIGLLTISDVMYCLAHDRDPDSTLVNSMMTRCELIEAGGTKNPCAQLDEDGNALAALKVMFAAGVNHLVVSSSAGNPIGIVSSLELIRLLSR